MERRAKSIAVLPRVVVLGDGARWIWDGAAEQFGDRLEIVDVMHAIEHVWAVAKGVLGETSEQSRSWANARVAELLDEGVDPVLRAFGSLPISTIEQRELVRRERGTS
ncbi:MAG: hypothetical protein U0821_10350 [Chloroflexota bacterium]